ncbi:MAG: hypothetical protein ABIR92_08200, partial [Gemmatimonadaceae bacterium]
MNRTLAIALALFGPALPLAAQSSAAACAATEDSTARQIIKTFDGLRVCMLAIPGDSAIGGGPRHWMTAAARVILETQRPDDFRRMSMGIASGRVDWTINGKLKDYDGPSVAWRSAVIVLLAKADEAEHLRGQVSYLRLQIDSLPQLRKRTAQEITATEQGAASLNQAIMKLQSDDRSLRAQVSQMEQRIRDLQGQADREAAVAARATDVTARTRAQNAVRQLELEIRRLEDRPFRTDRQRLAMDAERRVPLLEQDLADLRPDHTMALLRMKLGNLEALSVPALERELTGLDADNRLRVLDAEIAKALADLRSQLGPPAESARIRQEGEQSDRLTGGKDPPGKSLRYVVAETVQEVAILGEITPERRAVDLDPVQRERHDDDDRTGTEQRALPQGHARRNSAIRGANRRQRHRAHRDCDDARRKHGTYPGHGQQKQDVPGQERFRPIERQLEKSVVH